MAKISISIPDELAEQLETYAADSGFKRSGAVSHILTAFFAGEVRSPEEFDLASVADQLNQVVAYLDELREKKPKVFHRPEWSEDEADPKRTRFSGIGRGGLRPPKS